MYRMSEREEFDAWVLAVSERLEMLHKLVAEDQIELDYSIHSLDILEAWFLRRYPGLNAVLAPEEFYIVDAAGTYVGKTFRRYLGGNWVIELKDQEYAYLGIPGLDNFKSTNPITPCYPVTWVTAAMDRRTGDFVRARIEKYLLAPS